MLLKPRTEYDTHLSKFAQLIPATISDEDKTSPTDFTRSRKLPLPKLITFTLSMVASGKNQGVDGKSGEFFKHARRSGIWFDSTAVSRSAVTKARNKVSWNVFETLFHDSVKLAYDIMPQNEAHTWHGHTVIAFDGSKYTLPATDELRESFDPKSGLEYKGKGHYPQCLVSTAYDVFRRLPLARAISSIPKGNEREDVKALLPQIIHQDAVLLFDRGYPSFDLIQHLELNYEKGYYVFRCPAKSTFPAVEAFVASGEDDRVIWLDPTSNFKQGKTKDDYFAIQLRVVRLENESGEVSVLITNLMDHKKYTTSDIIDIYFRRWGIETYYRDEKTYMEVEVFHSKSENSIKQELFAIMIMSLITRTLMNFVDNGTSALPQFKHAMLTLASDAALLVPENPMAAAAIFREVLSEIARVKNYQPKNQRSPPPRVCKKSQNKWQKQKSKAK